MMAGRGVLAVLFGAAIALWRIPVFDAVVVSFGTYAIADGLLAIASVLRAARPRTTGWPIALEGIVSIVLGGLVFVWPFFPRRAIGVLIAWGVLTGICEIVAAVQWQADHFEEIPVLVVACLRGTRLPWPNVAAASFYGSIFPSVQNLLLAARAVNLGAALITLPLWSTWSARRILGCPWSVQPCAVIPLGWPRGRYGPTTRRPVRRGSIESRTRPPPDVHPAWRRVRHPA